MADHSKTHVGIVLDESGSMEPVCNATISAMNEYIATLRKGANGVDFRVTLTQFNTDKTEIVYSAKPIADVPKLTHSSYQPRAMTPLYDAVGRTIRGLDGEVNDTDRVLFVIMTDGQENSSTEFTRQQVFDLVKEREAKGNWTTVFLGANQDAYVEAQKMAGVSAANITNYASTPAGVAAVMASVGEQSVKYAASNLRSTAQFFSPSDLAQSAGVSPSTIQREIKKGNIKVRRTPGGHARIGKEDADRWLTGKT